jgi:hypothetical protein
MTNRNAWFLIITSSLSLATTSPMLSAMEIDKQPSKEEHVPVGERRNVDSLSFVASLKKRYAEENKNNEEHIPVGNRSLSHVEWVKQQEQREKVTNMRNALMHKDDCDGCSKCDKDRKTVEETIVQDEMDDAVAFDEAEKKSFRFCDEEPTDEELVAKKTYYTSHKGAFHRPIAVTPLGDEVTLEDGSVWKIKYDHRYKTLDWLAGDNILVLPNHAWFSSYYYRLVNQNTGADVETNLFLGPIYNGVYTHWIVAIDYFNNEICLEDGSTWKIAGGDYGRLKKWLVNDTIIIGINDSWFSSKPNILINVNMLNFVCGICQNGFN